MIYDYLVIGGGIAGVSAAYELSAQGSVLVLEAEDTTAFHATGRSAALFTRNYGGPAVRKINAASANFFHNPPDGFCETPLLTPRGCLTVSLGDHDAALDAVLALSEPGEEITEITPQQACTMVPFLPPNRVSRAVYESNVTDIDVATLHLSYLKGAKARGAQILTSQPVTALSRSAGVWRVETPTGKHTAAHIINAAGAWAEQIGTMAGAASIGLVPKRRTAIIIDGPDGLDASALPAIDFAGSDAYLKPDAGKLMASPGDATPSAPMDAWPDDMDIAVLADWVERHTTLEVKRIAHSWAGLRSFVPDEAPVVGFDPDVPDFFWLAAQGGYGIMMAPTLAWLTADICSGTATPRHAAYRDAVAPSRLTAPKS